MENLCFKRSASLCSHASLRLCQFVSGGKILGDLVCTSTCRCAYQDEKEAEILGEKDLDFTRSLLSDPAPADTQEFAGSIYEESAEVRFGL